MMPAWAWWLGGPLLGVVALAAAAVLRRPFGVSGSWERVITRRATAVSIDQAELAAELLRETHEAMREAGLTPPPLETPPVIAGGASRPWTADAMLLLGLVAGGAVASWLQGAWRLQDTLDPALARSLGTGAWPALFLGGICVGFGTRLAGGCTSGHGLSGCGRMKGSSVVATTTFFAGAVATALVIDAVTR